MGHHQVAKLQNGALAQRALFPEVHLGKLAHRARVIQRLFHRRIRQVVQMLHEIDTQHLLQALRQRPGPCGSG